METQKNKEICPSPQSWEVIELIFEYKFTHPTILAWLLELVRYITYVHRPRLWYRGGYGRKNNLQNPMDTGTITLSFGNII